jgi:hypothetical protein
MADIPTIASYIEVLADLHSRWQFHLPLVAANFQYRERYYGLASAQLLEDMFLDALHIYMEQHVPNHQLGRPPRGVKEYDYEFDGEKISHKVSKAGAIEIAVLWDATKVIPVWSAPHTIALENAYYSTKSISVNHSAIKKATKLLTVSHSETYRQGDQVALTFWQDRQLEVRQCWTLQEAGLLRDTLPFGDVWKEFKILDQRTQPINEHELFVFRPTNKLRLEPGTRLLLNKHVLRPGTYVFPASMFVNVALKRNNRGQLIPRDLVKRKMLECLEAGSFVPSTTWYSAYSSSEPPNLFLTQRQELDARFSSANLGYTSGRS